MVILIASVVYSYDRDITIHHTAMQLAHTMDNRQWQWPCAPVRAHSKDILNQNRKFARQQPATIRFPSFKTHMLIIAATSPECSKLGVILGESELLSWTRNVHAHAPVEGGQVNVDDPSVVGLVICDEQPGGSNKPLCRRSGAVLCSSKCCTNQ